MLILAACAGGATPVPTQAPATPGPTTAQSSGPQATANALADVCEKGKAEGKVVYYGSYDDTMKPMVEKFKIDHPGIEVELLSGTTDQFVAKVLTEDSAGRPPEQDVQEGSMPLFAPLMDRKLAASDIDWVSLGVPKDRVNSAGFTRINRSSYGIGYNSTKVKPEDLPNSYEELLDPKYLKYKGLLSMDPLLSRLQPLSVLALGPLLAALLFFH